MKALLLFVLSASFLLQAEEGKPRVARRSLPIGGRWNLTASSIEKTKTEGTRTLLLTATGEPTLKRGANVFKGPWQIEAKAERVECDFIAKKFILTGSPEVRRRAVPPAVGWEIVAGEVGSVVELGLVENSLNVIGAAKTHTEP